MATRSRHWFGRIEVRIGILVSSLVLLGGGFFALSNPVLYRASSTLVVLPDASANSVAGYYDTLSRGQVVLTFAQILDLRAAGPAADGRGSTGTTVKAVPDTSLIEIVAVARSGSEAEASADAVLVNARPYIDDLRSPFTIYLVRGAAGSAEKTGGVPAPLFLLIPLIAVVSGFVSQQALRALRPTSAAGTHREATQVRDQGGADTVGGLSARPASPRPEADGATEPLALVTGGRLRSAASVKRD